MVEKEKQNSNTASKSSSLVDVLQNIARLADNAGSKAEFFRDALGELLRHFQGVFGIIHIRQASEVIEEYQHLGPGDPAFWKSPVKQFLNEALSRGQAGMKLFASRKPEAKVTLALHALPVFSSSAATIGAVVLVGRCQNRIHAENKLTELESVCAYLSFCADKVGHDSSSRNQDQQSLTKNLSRIAGYSSVEEMAFAITNNLRSRIDCEQVVLGVVARSKVNIVSVSGHDHFHKSSLEIALVCAAMEECLDFNKTIIYQDLENDSPEKIAAHFSASQAHPAKPDQPAAQACGFAKPQYRLHQEWHQATKHAAVASIPLFDGEKCNVIISLRQQPGKSLTEQQLQSVQELTEPYTAAFDLLTRANQNLTTHLTHSAHKHVKALTKPEKWLKKVILLLAVLFVSWFCLGTLDYKVTITGKVVPRDVLHLAVPQNARLLSASVLQGDYVNQGDLLCRFDSEQLQLERKNLLAQLQVARLQENDGLIGMEDAAARLARANREGIEAKLKIIDRRIADTVIEAPFDGLIVSGDLRRQIGQLMPQGEPLFEIASSQKWRIELDVPENYAPDFHASINGNFAFNARPDLKEELIITRFASGATISKGRNIYIAEADAKLDYPWIKAGMEGHAALKLGRRPVWWIAFHRVIDYLRLKLWL